MSSEEMRNELEAFVNAGLREGWRGWPLKEARCAGRTLVLPAYVKPARFWSRQRAGWTLGVSRVARRYCVEN
jgi:hypothetical protein